MNEPSKQQQQRSIAATAAPDSLTINHKQKDSTMPNEQHQHDQEGSLKVAPEPPSLEDDNNDQMNGNSPSKTKQKMPTLEGTVMPKVARIPLYRFIYLSILVALPTALYISVFTALGWGETTFAYLSTNYGDYTGVLGGLTAVWFLTLYLLDANTWNSRVLQGLVGTIFVVGVMATITFVSADYPFGPICVFAAVTPLWLLSAISLGRQGATLHNRTKDYVRSLSGPLFFISLLVLSVFIAYTFVDDAHEYNQVTQVVFAQTTGCPANLVDYPECAHGYIPQPDPLPSPSTTITTTNGTATNDTATTTNNDTQSRWLHEYSDPNHNHNDDSNNINSNNYFDGLLEPTEFLQTEQKEEDPNSKGSSKSTQTFEAQQTYQLVSDYDYSAQETGVCFDTVVSPPSFTLEDFCDPNCPRNVYSDCTGALLLWAGPLLCSMVLFFLSFFCTFLQGDDVEKDIINFGKLWLFLLFTVWITVSLAGVGSGMTTVLAAMTLASFVGAIFFVTMTRPKHESKEQAWLLWAKFEEKCGGYLNVARAIFLVFCTPLLMVYFCLAVINQAVRKLGLPCSKTIKSEEERADFVTKRARLQITDMRSWDRTKVLTYGVYVGLTYMILSVVISKFAYLIMTILVEALKDLDLAAVTAILIAFGLTFFLNPFLPGPPVYTMNGLVLFVTGVDTLGVGGALAYGVALSLVIKLLACTMQQKLIGENLSKYVTVRKLVGINSGLIKATKLILSQPGIKIDKVSILVGGPDWPTSVLCGIMHLDLLPILLGTVPILVIAAPTALLGAFLYMADLKGDDGELVYPSAASLAALATALAAVVCLAVPIMAAYYLEQKMAQAADEIAAMPMDKEVAELEEAEVTYNEAYEQVTKWEVLPGVAKLIIYIAFAMMVVSVYIVLIVPKQCFVDYSLTSTVEDDLDGEWTNLVKPLGWISIALFMVSWGIVGVFTSWASSQAKELVAAQKTWDDAPAVGGAEQPIPAAAP